MDEIHQQPDIVGRLVEAERANAMELAAEIKRRGIEYIVMAARGTSDHAAIYGKYLFEVHNAFPVSLADLSVFTLYSAKLKLDRTLVIGISQSGQATDVAECLTQSKALGALTLAITNEPGSTISQIADFTMLCHAEKEIAVAATKTYTSTLAALYMLSASLDGSGCKIDHLFECAEYMQAAFSMEEFIAFRAERYRYMRSGTVLSRGFNYCTALETALKLAETNYVGMRAYSAADFLHGPIAAIHEGDPCILIAPPGRTYNVILDMAEKLRSKKADTLIISSEDEVLSLATVPVKLTAKVDEELSPLIYIIPGQLFAYYLAVEKGYNPDQPRGLSKVTLTR